MLPFVVDFNSIKVRLEHKNAVQHPKTPKFQFHKGAIRTVSSAALNYANAKFQFHKGAIRTLDRS